MKRNPLERVDGRYNVSLDGLEDFSAEVVKNISEKYPTIDLIDLEYIFTKHLSFQFSKRYLEEFERE